MLMLFQEPSVSLKSYSDDQLNIIAQLPLTLKQRDYEVSSIILIQKYAPNNLLILTDLQPTLGFSLIVKKSAKQETMLLEENLQGSDTAVEPQESDSRVAHLLTAVKLPARHQKLIKARAGEWLSKGLALFTPTVTELGVADAMVQVEADQCFTLIVENRGPCHMELEKNMLLGALKDAAQITSSEKLISNMLVLAISYTSHSREKLLLGRSYIY